MNLAQMSWLCHPLHCQCKGSTIARESDYVLYTHAGPEIAVASTKAYSVQLAALYMIGCRMALVRGAFGQDEHGNL